MMVRRVAEFEPVESSFASLAEGVAFEQVQRVPGEYKHGRFFPSVPTQKPVLDPELRARVRGRPTDYRAEYCDLVIEDMLDGYSLTAFAGRLGVSRDRLNEWMARYPNFNEAVAQARSLRLRVWETDANQVRQTGGNGSQATMIIFGLKNMGADEWRDKQEIDVSGKLTLAALVESSLKTINAPLIEHDQQVSESGEGDRS